MKVGRAGRCQNCQNSTLRAPARSSNSTPITTIAMGLNSGPVGLATGLPAASAGRNFGSAAETLDDRSRAATFTGSASGAKSVTVALETFGSGSAKSGTVGTIDAFVALTGCVSCFSAVGAFAGVATGGALATTFLEAGGVIGLIVKT